MPNAQESAEDRVVRFCSVGRLDITADLKKEYAYMLNALDGSLQLYYFDGCGARRAVWIKNSQLIAYSDSVHGDPEAQVFSFGSFHGSWMVSLLEMACTTAIETPGVIIDELILQVRKQKWGMVQKPRPTEEKPCP